MNVALFTKCFLEPTHVAIAQILQGLPEHRFRVFAKAYGRVPGFDMPNATPTADLSSGPCIPQLAAGCDVIQAIFDGNVAFDAFEVSQKVGRPFLLSFHGGFDTNVSMWKPKRRELTRTVAERAAVVTVVCETDVARLRELGVKRGIEVLPVPVDFSAIPSTVTPVPGELIAIGRLIPKKGYETAIESLLYTPSSFCLRVVGNGPEEARLRALAADLGVSSRVEFTGFLPLPDVLRALARAIVLLHPARVAEDGNAEGTPQVVLWAQAIGVPVVAGASGSVRDVIRDRVTGRLVPPNNARSLAEAVQTLAEVEHERTLIIEEARSWVRSHHELSTVLDLWRRTYARASITPARKHNRGDALSALTSEKPLRFQNALIAAVASLGDEVDCLLIESGGQGVVLWAQPPTGDAVAIKVANYNGDDPADVWLTEHRIRKEGAALAELARRGCRAVPRLHWMDPDGRFLIREYFPGTTIEDAALKLPLAERARLLPVLMHSCSLVFRTFHENGTKPYVIRDLKPRNLILLRDEERVVLIDVGSSRPAGRQSKSPRSKIRLGTRNWLYWSPELLLSQGARIDVSSDYFSLGATAFYFLLARAPFSNAEQDSERALDRYLKEYSDAYVDWLRQCDLQGVPVSLAEFVARCMHPTPTERPTFGSSL